MAARFDHATKINKRRNQVRAITPSPSLKGLVPVLIKPENRSQFYIFCRPDQVESKTKEVLSRYNVKAKDYLKIAQG